MTKAPSAPGAGRGAMTAAPSPTDRGTWQQSQNTEKVETQEKGQYATATKNYEAALKTNKAKAPNPESLKAANDEALAAYNAEKAQITLWKAKQVKAVGVIRESQSYRPRRTDLCHDERQGLVNINTGFPYEGK